MKTPMQEHIEWLKKEYKKLESAGELGIALHIGDCIEHAESMLEKEKEVMVDFAYKFGDEPLSEIHKWYDKQFKTKEI